MKRFLAMLLCAAMLLSMSPLAYATAEDFAPETAVEGSIPEPVEDPIPEGEEEPTEEPVEEPTEEPADDSIPEPVKDPTMEPDTEPTEELIPEEEEPLPEPAEEPEELLPVCVRFLCEPAELTLTVWEKAAKESETAEAPAVPIEPQEDGSWLLLPGDYLYSAECEGYEPLALEPLSVAEETEVTVTLAPSVMLFAAAAETANSGTCGTDLRWTLDETGTLTISGTGAMEDYVCGDDRVTTNAPWDGVKGNIKAVVMEAGAESIGSYAFLGCFNLTDVTIPGSVMSIGAFAFNCSSLTSVTIPESVASIGEQAFGSCNSLTNTIIPGSVTSLGIGTFCDCTSLTGVTIQNGVTTIAERTFWNCTSLTSVAIPESVTSISMGAFDGCTALSDVYYGGTAEQWVAITFRDYNEPLTGANIHYGTVMPSSGTCGEKLTWTLDEAGTLTISGTGAMENYESYEPNPYSGAPVPWNDIKGNIKEVVIEEGITSIGDYAFICCNGLTSVTIPDSVTSIGDYAFTADSSLASITLPEGVTSIGDYAFFSCALLADVTIPASVTAIGAAAFKGVDGVVVDSENPAYQSINGALFNKEGTEIYCVPDRFTEYTIPDGVRTIGDEAFAASEKLTSVTIPESVTSIGNKAFYLCNSLTELSIPKGVTSIGIDAFRNCSSLTSITIPESVTSIGEGAFFGTSLADVYYGGTEEQWSAITVGDYNGLLTGANIHYAEAPATSGTCGENLTWALDDAGTLTISGTGAMEDYVCGDDRVTTNAPWDGVKDNIKKVVVGEGATSIGSLAFYECGNLTNVTIPDSVASIGDSAFSGCSSLASVTIPNGVTSISFSTFLGCSSLTSVIIPDGVTSIGSSAFAGCSRLESITIPQSVTSIGMIAFIDCAALTDVYYGGTEAQWAAITVGDGNEPLTKATVHCAIAAGTCGENLTWKLDEAGTLTISGTGAMADYSISDGRSAPWYSERDSIIRIVIQDGATSIGDEAFPFCSKVKEISIPEGVTSIGTSALDSCGSLANIALPKSLESIGIFAFSGTKGVIADKESPVFKSENGALFSKDGTEILFVPSNVSKYTVPAGVTKIGDGSFSACKLLKSVSLPEGVTSIGYCAFDSCSALTEVKLPKSLTTIGALAFIECTGLKTVHIPANVRTIGAAAFDGCTSLCDVYFAGTKLQWDTIAIEIDNEALTSANIRYEGKTISGTCGENLTWVLDGNNVLTISGSGSMGESPEYEWNRYSPYITKVVIEAGVTDVGVEAFLYCTALTEVVLPRSVTAIRNGAFCFCSALEKINLPTGLTSIEAYAFFGCDALTNVKYPGDIFMWRTIEIGEGNECLLANYSPALPQWGSCGENLKWELDEDYVLTISGSGSMGASPEYSWSGYSPYITKVVIEEGVTDVGVEAFLYCTALTEAVLPSTVTEIKGEAFCFCSALEKINLPAGLTGIGSYAFYGCSSLTNITIPKSTAWIGVGAFGGCSALAAVVYQGAAADWSKILIDSGNENLTSLIRYDPPANSILITTADGGAVPEEIDMQQELALKAALEPAECNSKIEWTASNDVAVVDENGVVHFQNVGEVTITATAVDSGAVSNSVTLKVYYVDKAEVLTAATDRPTNSLNPGETLSLFVFGEDKTTAIAPEKLSFFSDNEKVATVDGNGVITAIGTGTATITAALRGDPLGRSVNVGVTVMPASEAAGFTVVGIKMDELHMEKSDTVRTLRIALVNAEGEELDITRFTLKSSDAKVAKVGKITDKKDVNCGEYGLTIPKNATGACTITATPKDKTLKGAETTLAVFVEDYTPRIGSTKLTLNSYQTAGASTSLIPSYGNEINGAIKVYEKAGKAYAETVSERLAASCADDVLTITTVDGEPIAKNQTINVRLAIPTMKGEQTVDLAVVVKNALPKVTVKQTQKKNLFYSDSEGIFSVTAKDAEIASMDYEIGGFRYAGSDGTIAVGGTDGAKSGVLTVEFEGYNTAYVKKGLTFATVNTKPALAAAPTSGTISAEGDVDYAVLNIYNKTAKQNLNLDEVSITATEGYSVSTSGEELMLMPEAELLDVAKKTARRVTLQIQGETWASPITVRYTLNIQPKKTLPAAKLKTGTLTLNLKYPEAAAETALTLDQTNRSIDEAVFTCAKTDAITVSYENGVVTARLNGGTVKAGSYSFAGTVTSDGDALKPVKLTVKVINSNASATVKASGKLDAIQRETSGITYTVTVKNINGIIEDIQMLSPTGKLSRTVVDGSELFDLETCGTDAKGQPKLRLTLKPDAEYSTKLTYKLRFGFTVNGTEVITKDVSVKVTQSTIKVKAENASQTVYQSQDRDKTVSYRIKLTSPADARIGTIEIGKLNTVFRKSLADAASSISWNIAPDGKSATVRVRINDTSKLVSGKTYTLPLVISGEGTAGGASAKINLTLKVAK